LLVYVTPACVLVVSAASRRGQVAFGVTFMAALVAGPVARRSM
jgi:hypothetical protein